MELREILIAIEDLFYNFVAWIALYPKTMLWAFFRPGTVQQYVTEEWEKPQEERFQRYLNPFIFWLLSMILFIWSISGSGEAETISMALQAFTLAMVLFAMLPAIFGGLMLSAQGKPLTIDLLRRPLYIQMVIFGAAQTLIALEFAAVAPLNQVGAVASDFLASLVILATYLVWFLVIAAIFLWIPIAQVRIFMKELTRSWTKVLGWVLLGLFLGGLLIASMPFISSELDLVSEMLVF